MESNAWCPPLTAATILSGLAVQVNGFGSALVSATKRLMAAWRSMTERKTPRFNRRRLSLAKNPSTALSQEHEVGVKWKTKRVGGDRARHEHWGVCELHSCRELDDLADRNLRLDVVEKSNEFLMAMTLHVAAGDRAVEDVEGGEQRRGAVPLVIVCHGSEPALLQRQAWLGAIEGLNLALLVDRQHDGMGRRINIESDNVAQLGDEVWIVRELELRHR
jgi:hypothetical protein